MTDEDRHEILVVDDNPVFPIRLWRILSSAYEFGIEDSDVARLREPLVSPDNSFALTWFNPSEDGTLRRFEEQVRRLGTRPNVWAIIDVHYVSDARSTYTDYRDTYLRLRPSRISVLPEVPEKRSPEERDSSLWIVSSYRIAESYSGEIKPKSLEQLELLRDAITGDARARRASVTESTPEVCHILVTGAGFELQPHPSALGLPPTSTLLCEVEVRRDPALTRSDPVAEEIEKITWEKQAKGYPLPRGRLMARDGAKLKYAASECDLDAYFLQMLEEARRLYTETFEEDSLARKIGPDSFEFRLRDAFRRSIAKYDFGHMMQHELAVGLNWDLWLTTNYTRFIDRAVDAFAPERWNVVQTVIEARVLSQQLGAGYRRSRGAKCAIKLHGDIGQVLTMAIAANDKRGPSTTLSVRPDLEAIYTAADGETYECLRDSRKECFWHVVGHGMRDERLVRSIDMAIEKTPNVAHRLLFVAPDAASIREHMAAKFARHGHAVLIPVPETAQSYMARLRRDGLASAAVRIKIDAA